MRIKNKIKCSGALLGLVIPPTLYTYNFYIAPSQTIPQPFHRKEATIVKTLEDSESSQKRK